MICRSADPLADFDRQDAEEYASEQLCPICDACGDRITDDYFLRIGEYCYHEGCVEHVELDFYLDEKRRL